MVGLLVSFGVFSFLSRGKDHHVIVVVRLALPCSFSACQLAMFPFLQTFPPKVSALYKRLSFLCVFVHLAFAVSCWQHTLISGGMLINDRRNNKNKPPSCHAWP